MVRWGAHPRWRLVSGGAQVREEKLVLVVAKEVRGATWSINIFQVPPLPPPPPPPPRAPPHVLCIEAPLAPLPATGHIRCHLAAS